MGKEVLIACEESQEVCKAFRAIGVKAYSCDLLDCSGGHPQWHIKDDAIKILNSKRWDLVIAFPPCDRLANSGVRWLHERNLWDELEAACIFFNQFVEYGKRGNKLLIENPIQHKHARKRIEKYNQIIQPYQYGHLEKKATCLWLYGLPKLKEAGNVFEEMMKLDYKDRAKIHTASPGKNRKKIRSKTYSGIAQAIARQYSALI